MRPSFRSLSSALRNPPIANHPLSPRTACIGFLGLGRMGSEMAFNLFSKHHQAHLINNSTANNNGTSSSSSRSDASFVVCDAVPESAQAFARKFLSQFPGANIRIVDTPDQWVIRLPFFRLPPLFDFFFAFLFYLLLFFCLLPSFSIYLCLYIPLLPSLLSLLRPRVSLLRYLDTFPPRRSSLFFFLSFSRRILFRNIPKYPKKTWLFRSDTFFYPPTSSSSSIIPFFVLMWWYIILWHIWVLLCARVCVLCVWSGPFIKEIKQIFASTSIDYPSALFPVGISNTLTFSFFFIRSWKSE